MLYQLSYSRNGMWPQATTILLVIICCTSQGAGWFRAFFDKNNSFAAPHRGRDDLERFFDKNNSTRLVYKNRLNHPAPHFPKYCPPSPLQTAVRTDKIQGWQTAQFNRCLWRWQEDERARQSGHPESSQGPSDFCTVYSQMLYQLSYSRNGMWPQATTILLVIICCTSQGAGWFRAFFDKNNSFAAPHRGRDDLERFFDKNNSTRLVYKNRLNHPAPHFPKYCPPSPLQTAVRTGKIQGWQTAQFNRCLWRWQEDERARQSGHPESSQGPSAQSTVRCSTNWAIAGMACGHRLQLSFL